MKARGLNSSYELEPQQYTPHRVCTTFSLCQYYYIVLMRCEKFLQVHLLALVRSCLRTRKPSHTTMGVGDAVQVLPCCFRESFGMVPNWNSYSL